MERQIFFMIFFAVIPDVFKVDPPGADYNNVL